MNEKKNKELERRMLYIMESKALDNKSVDLAIDNYLNILFDEGPLDNENQLNTYEQYDSCECCDNEEHAY
jgi:hypothetical protein